MIEIQISRWVDQLGYSYIIEKSSDLWLKRVLIFKGIENYLIRFTCWNCWIRALKSLEAEIYLTSN